MIHVIYYTFDMKSNITHALFILCFCYLHFEHDLKKLAFCTIQKRYIIQFIVYIIDHIKITF